MTTTKLTAAQTTTLSRIAELAPLTVGQARSSRSLRSKGLAEMIMVDGSGHLELTQAGWDVFLSNK